MKYSLVFTLLGAFFTSGLAQAESGNLVGKVAKIRLHQYLNNAGWDKQIWFCLDTTATVGTCATTNACGGKTSLVISKDASPEIYSTVLAARLSNTEITVNVNDAHTFSGHCYARLIDL